MSRHHEQKPCSRCWCLIFYRPVKVLLNTFSIAYHIFRRDQPLVGSIKSFSFTVAPFNARRTVREWFSTCTRLRSRDFPAQTLFEINSRSVHASGAFPNVTDKYFKFFRPRPSQFAFVDQRRRLRFHFRSLFIHTSMYVRVYSNTPADFSQSNHYC